MRRRDALRSVGRSTLVCEVFDERSRQLHRLQWRKENLLAIRDLIDSSGLAAEPGGIAHHAAIGPPD